MPCFKLAAILFKLYRRLAGYGPKVLINQLKAFVALEC